MCVCCIIRRRCHAKTVLAAGICCLVSVYWFFMTNRFLSLTATQEIKDTGWVQRVYVTHQPTSFQRVYVTHQPTSFQSVYVTQQPTRFQPVHVYRQSTNQTCVQPILDPFEPSVMQFYEQAPSVDCSGSMKDWVYTTNGNFHISQDAVRLYGHITCQYLPLVRVDDFKTSYGPPLTHMVDGMPLPSDFFKVDCKSTSGHHYSNFHSGVAWNNTVHARLEELSGRQAATTFSSSPTSSSAPVSSASPSNVSPTNNVQQFPSLNLSVFIFGFDSVSRMSWIRQLPRTRSYFLDILGGLELEGYNIVGDGTPAALLPILTGYSEEELPEARRGVSDAKPVDGHPWVWKDFQRHGYVTAYAEDMADLGTFQLRMLGFKEQPTDHYRRPFQLASEKLNKFNPPFCLGSKPRHVIFMNWFEDLFDMYQLYPKFFFGFYAEMSHGSNTPLQALDLDMASFLQRLEEKGHLNSTLLILMADHGARYPYFRATVQGKLEERMPYVAFRFPTWLKQTHPQLVKNFQTNTHRLTTPFDVHQTLLEVLAYTGSGVADISERAVSLFKEVPQNRSCTHAGITPHWCACLNWVNLKTSDVLSQSAVRTTLSVINSYTENKRSTCAKLRLKEITHAARYTPSLEDYLAEQQVRVYESILPRQGRSSLDATSHREREIYQVSFVTSPGDGLFQATCTLNIASGHFSVAITDISRMNAYGNDADCIVGTIPQLRPFCYCV